MRHLVLITLAGVSLGFPLFTGAATAQAQQSRSSRVDAAKLERRLAELERQVAELRKELQNLRREDGDSSATAVYHAKSTLALKLAQALSEVLGEKARTILVPEPITNKLLLRGDAKKLKQIMEILSLLDAANE